MHYILYIYNKHIIYLVYIYNIYKYYIYYVILYTYCNIIYIKYIKHNIHIIYTYILYIFIHYIVLYIYIYICIYILRMCNTMFEVHRNSNKKLPLKKGRVVFHFHVQKDLILKKIFARVKFYEGNFRIHF